MRNLIVKSFLLLLLSMPHSYAQTTFKSGSTFSNGKWHNPGESPTAKTQLEQNGFYVSGTALTIRLGDEDYTVDLREMSGKSKQMRQDFVKDEIKKQITEKKLIENIPVPEELTGKEADAYRQTVWNEMGGMSGVEMFLAQPTITENLDADLLDELGEELTAVSELAEFSDLDDDVLAILEEELAENLTSIDETLAEVSATIETEIGSQLEEITATIEEGVEADGSLESFQSLSEDCLNEC